MTSLALWLLMAAPHASLQVYFEQALASAAYQKQVFDKVARAWTAPADSKAPKLGQKAVVQVVIDGKGAIVTSIISMQSGSPMFDAAVLAAVRRAAPFPPPPISGTEFHVHVTWSS
jgi:protein TonB